MRTTKIERVRGVNDVLPDTCTADRQIQSQLQTCFESFGYRPIDVRLIEYTELYLKKSGEDIAERLFDFVYRNRRLCLRPELTASVVRAYVDHLQGNPLPVRLFYCGSAFRYERPQKGRYRQFTQMGIEMVGTGGAIADAEVIALACQGLDRLDLSSYRVAIGHIGVLTKFLDSLQLETRLSSFLLGNMEILRKDGKAEVERRLKDIYPDFGEENLQETTEAKTLTNVLQNMAETEARTAILELLDSMNIQLVSTREPAEIVDRLLVKMKRQDQTYRLTQALEFMHQLSQLVGEPGATIQEAKKLLSSYDIEHSGLEQLQSIINTLEHYHIDRNKIVVDFSLSRGLQYYTGMVFEVYHGNFGDERQLCGGGRYDNLVAGFGGRQETPATGFSYGIERLRLALEAEGKLPKSEQLVEVLVVPVNEEDAGYAIAIAEKLRSQGLRVELDVRDKGVSSNFQYANKQNIPFAIIVGEKERLAAEVVLRDMNSREEQRLPIGEVAAQIQQMRGQNAN